MSKPLESVAIEDLRLAAQRRLPEFLFVPVEGGDGDGAGPTRNAAAFSQWLFNARALVAMAPNGLKTEMFGRTYALPFGISAIGGAGKFRPHADEMFAEAAKAADVPFILSGASSASVEVVTRIAPDHVWQQLYVARNPAVSERFAARAADAGVKVLVMTVDAPVHQRNLWIARKGIVRTGAIKPSAWPYVLWQSARHPNWALDMVRSGGMPGLESWAEFAEDPKKRTSTERAFQDNMPGVQSWSEVERIRRLWPGTLIVKGVVDPDDAERALQLGADAVTVSNHGGNKFDRMAAALDYLPEVAGRVAGRAPILFDGGIRRGSDLAVAHALGAQFCFLGRAALYGVVAAGAPGVKRVIDILADDLGRRLATIGAPSIDEIGPWCLRPRVGTA